MALGRFSIREVRSRPGRAVLTLLSVVIGVAMIISVSVATSTTRRAVKQIFDTVNGRSPLEVVSEAGAAFDQAVATKIQKVPGVEAAIPVVRQPAIMYYGDHKRITVFALGVDPAKDAAIREHRLVAGRELTAADEGLMVDSGLAEKLDLKVDDTVKLLTRSGLEKFTIVGLSAPTGAAASGQAMIFLSLGTAQENLRASGKIDSVQIVVREGAVLDKVEAEIKAALPNGLVTLRSTARRSQADETLRSTEQAVLLATCFSWLLALLLVLNTFQMNVVERRRQLAILRAIGATRRQIMWLVCREALTMGIAGTLIGIVIGLAGAAVLSRATFELLQIPLPAMQVSWEPLLLAAIIGPAISVLGAVFPAWRAGQLSPLEGMGAVVASDSESPPWWIGGTGVSIFSVGGLFIKASFMQRVPMNISIIAALAMLVGVVLLLPVMLSPMARAAGVALSWIMGVEGRLAQGQIVRRRGRTTLTVGVLFLAISFGIGMANTIVDSIYDVQRWCRNASQGDFFVRAMMPDMNTGLACDLPEQVGKEIRQIPDIAAIQTVRFAKADVLGQGVIILAGDFGEQQDERFRFELITGEAAGLREALRRGDVLIGTVLALRAKLKVGDEIPLETQEGRKTVRVAGTVNDYLGGGLTMYMDNRVAKKLLGIEGVDAYVIWAATGKLDGVEQALRTLSANHGVLLQTKREVLGLIDAMMKGLVACLWFLLVVVFMVAAFGVVNTLTMNVIEQTRELGLLRIVAMTRRQVRKMILAQAALLALIGLTPGVLAGLGVAYIINLSMGPLMGHPVTFVVHTQLTVACFATAFMIVLAAAWFPATRAARLKLTEALQVQ
ncbi:MAG: FtsX-like permease family protein [Planctomycetia bacterium]|nr:FtsX-like permease family protein [Planctomycetia bacterium]